MIFNICSWTIISYWVVVLGKVFKIWSINFIIVTHVRKCVRQIIGLCQAMRGHFSRKSSYWSKNFIMVLNVKTMTWYFEKNSVKTCKQHRIVCRLRNPHVGLKSCARKYFSISPQIKIQFYLKELKIRSYQFSIMY